MSVLLHLSLSTLHSRVIPSGDVHHFICSLDDAPFATCTSPQTYSSLDDDTHTFRVAAVDAVGNVDPTPALWKWTVDTTALDTMIDSAIDGNGNPVGNGGTTKSNSITFTFSGNPSEDVHHFVCTILGGGGPINPCISPQAV